MSSAVNVGEELPISLGLNEPIDNLFVRATVFDNNNNLINTLNCLPRGNGRYSFVGYLMPDFPYIIVRYVVYTDNTYSVRAEYEDVDEAYTAITSGSGGGLDPELADQIERAISELQLVNVEMEFLENIEAFIELEENQDAVVDLIPDTDVIIEAEVSGNEYDIYLIIDEVNTISLE